MKTKVTRHTEKESPMDVFNYNIERLQSATTQTCIVISEELLTASEKTINDFQIALAKPHMLHHITHLKAYVVAVNSSDEQFQAAIRYYSSQEQTKAYAQFKKFRKGWKLMAQANNGEAGMGFFLFMLPPINMTKEAFAKALKPEPLFTEIAEYVHPSGLVDEIFLVATTQERMDELRFRVTLTHVSKIHELVGVVTSVADPEHMNRAQIRVKYLTPDLTDENLPWAGAHVPAESLASINTPIALPLVGSTVSVFLTFNRENGYIMTYGHAVN